MVDVSFHFGSSRKPVANMTDGHLMTKVIPATPRSVNAFSPLQTRVHRY